MAQSVSDEIRTRDDALRQADLARREAILREEATRMPAVHSGDAGVLRQALVPGEAACSVIHDIEFRGPVARRFDGLRRDAAPVLNGCWGPRSLAAIVHNLTARLYSQGFITSRVSLASEPVVQGVLRLRVHAGRVRELKLVELPAPADGRARSPSSLALHMALPAHEGNVLNLRDLDHGAENIQRLPGHSLVQYLVPVKTSQPPSDDEAPMHDVVLQWQQARWWQGSVTLDNSSARSMGRTLLSTHWGASNLLGLAEHLQLFAYGNAESPGPEARNRGLGVRISVPWGYHRFGWSGNTSSNSQRIRGTTVDFQSRSENRDSQWLWQYTAYRDHRFRVVTDLAWGHQTGRSHIEDVELAVQRRDAQQREAGVTFGWTADTMSLSATLRYIEVARRKSPDTEFFFVDEPGRARTQRFEGQWQWSLPSPAQGWAYGFQWTLQHTRRPTPLSDPLSLGGRYSVRGFNGDQTLVAHDGLLLRQEIQAPGRVGRWGLPFATAPFVALDVGRVREHGVGAARRLSVAGAALGVRLSHARFFAELSVATPLHAPAAWSPPRLVPYLSVTYAF